MTAAAGRSVTYSGNNRRGGLRLPEHTHPLVRRFFAVMNARRVTLREVSGVSNVGVDTLRFWGTRHMPRLDLFDAALNTVGLELTIRQRRRFNRRKIVQGFNLTRAQRDGLAFIQDYIEREGQAPTYREISAGLSVRLSRVGVLLAQLKERGAIDYIKRRNRSIVVLANDAMPLVRLPEKLSARLAQYCRRHHESQEAVVADAVLLHLDEMDKEHAAEAERTLAGGGSR